MLAGLMDVLVFLRADGRRIVQIILDGEYGRRLHPDARPVRVVPDADRLVNGYLLDESVLILYPAVLDDLAEIQSRAVHYGSLVTDLYQQVRYPVAVQGGHYVLYRLYGHASVGQGRGVFRRADVFQ